MFENFSIFISSEILYMKKFVTEAKKISIVICINWFHSEKEG